MTYFGKPLPEVVADGERRRADQAAREQLHWQRVGRKLRRIRWACSALGALGLLGSALAYSVPSLLMVGVPLLALIPPTLIIARAWGVLLGLIAGGLTAGLPGILLIVLSGGQTAGSGMAAAAGLGQFIMLFFGGIGFPMIAGGICGLLRDRIDDDNLQI